MKTDFFLPFFQRKKYELEKSVLPRTRERERERGSSVVVVLVLVVYRRAGIFYTFFLSCYPVLFLEQNQVLFPRAVVHGSGTFHGS